jgi:DNA helicase-2/ATP-dependent DNA helicase PcrA
LLRHLRVTAAAGRCRATRAVDPNASGDEALFAALRSWRLETAALASVPAYVVARDRTLEAIASSKPRDASSLGAIHGVGPAFLERYGEAVLALVAASA